MKRSLLLPKSSREGKKRENFPIHRKTRPGNRPLGRKESQGEVCTAKETNPENEGGEKKNTLEQRGRPSTFLAY